MHKNQTSKGSSRILELYSKLKGLSNEHKRFDRNVAARDGKKNRKKNLLCSLGQKYLPKPNWKRSKIGQHATKKQMKYFRSIVKLIFFRWPKIKKFSKANSMELISQSNVGNNVILNSNFINKLEVLKRSCGIFVSRKNVHLLLL
jgi:hypothetical protein